MEEQANERPLPRTVQEWVKDQRGPIPPGRDEFVDRGLMTPWEAVKGLKDLWRRRD